MKRRALLLLLAAPMLLLGVLAGRDGNVGGAPAAACSCANGAAPSLAPYGAEVERPRNTRLRFSPIWNLPNYDAWGRANGFDGKKWNLELRRVGNPTVVPTEQRVVGTAEQRMLEVWPVTPLDPNAFYVVRASGAAEASPSGSPPLEGHFKTSGDMDTTPPTWAGATGARYLATGVEGDRSSCASRNPVIEIYLHAPKDDETLASDLVLGVWVPGAGGKLDYTSPPTVIAGIRAGHAYLGKTGYCSEADFVVKKEALRLGLRVLDFAGNASKPSEVTVDPEGRPQTPSAVYEQDPTPSAPKRRWGCGKTSGP